MPIRIIRVLVIATLSLVVGCGSDTPSKSEFVTRLREITDPPVDSKLAECAYDAMAKDQRLMQLALTTGSLPKADDDKLAKIFARCVLGPDAPTTAKQTTTTTKKKKST